MQFLLPRVAQPVVRFMGQLLFTHNHVGFHLLNRWNHLFCFSLTEGIFRSYYVNCQPNFPVFIHFHYSVLLVDLLPHCIPSLNLLHSTRHIIWQLKNQTKANTGHTLIRHTFKVNIYNINYRKTTRNPKKSVNLGFLFTYLSHCQCVELNSCGYRLEDLWT